MKKIQKLHDEIKEKYEKGDYNQQIESKPGYANSDKLSWYSKTRKRIYPIWLILFIATFFPRDYSLAHKLVRLHYTFMALLILNTVALIYFSYKISQSKNDTQPK